MIKIFSLIAFSAALVGANYSCNTTTSQIELSKNLTNTAVNIERQNVNPTVSVNDVSLLCNKLSELKILPYKDKVAGDYIYDGLVEKGKEAIPCLIEKIDDLTIMEDPREAPHIKDFRVGDAAVFMLHRITGEPLQSILPDEVAKQLKTEGVYAYFAYVETLQNRKKIQQWWKSKIIQDESAISK